MSISMDAACLQCGLRRNIATVTPLGTDKQTMDFARELMKLYLDGPADVPSTWFTPEITRLLHERYGLGLDRFRQEKLDSNALVLSHMEPIRQRVEQAADPLLAGLQFAILGNYLDFSALQGQISFETFTEMLDTAQDMALDEAVLSQFRGDLETGKKLRITVGMQTPAEERNYRVYTLEKDRRAGGICRDGALAAGIGGGRVRGGPDRGCDDHAGPTQAPGGGEHRHHRGRTHYGLILRRRKNLRFCDKFFWHIIKKKAGRHRMCLPVPMYSAVFIF